MALGDVPVGLQDFPMVNSMSHGPMMFAAGDVDLPSPPPSPVEVRAVTSLPLQEVEEVESCWRLKVKSGFSSCRLPLSVCFDSCAFLLCALCCWNVGPGVGLGGGEGEKGVK